VEAQLQSIYGQRKAGSGSGNDRPPYKGRGARGKNQFGGNKIKLLPNMARRNELIMASNARRGWPIGSEQD